MDIYVGMQLEYNVKPYFGSPDNWLPCVVVGKSIGGFPVIELQEDGPGMLALVVQPELLRPARICVEWFSRVVLSPKGVPFTLAFACSKEQIEAEILEPGYSWHGDIYSIIVETDSATGEPS